MTQSRGIRDNEESWIWDSLTQHSESALDELFKPPEDDAPVPGPSSSRCQEVTSTSGERKHDGVEASVPSPSSSSRPQEVMPVPSTSGKRKHDGVEASFVPAAKLRRTDVEQLKVYIVAHDPANLDNVSRTPYGVQYTLAYLISTGQLRYSALDSTMLCGLQGPNTMANDDSLMGAIKGDGHTSPTAKEKQMFAQEMTANSPWEEFDKEEQALAKDMYAGLGNHPDYPDWYGGKVVFRGKVKEDEGGGYKLVLDRGALGSSCRFTRRFGSKYFIRVKVDKSLYYDQSNRLSDFFQHRFVLWGHVFRACYAKDDNVFLIKVNETMLADGSIAKTEGPSLADFINWFNPLDKNQKQPMSKWAARFALGFSNSVPGPQVSAADIHHEDDILSDCQSDMTDGSGFCNPKLLSRIRDHYKMSDKNPTAVQFRLGGCKGMLVLRDDDASSGDSFKIWVRPSQIKIRGQPSDPGHLTIDLLRQSSIRSPSQISSEVIINIAENGFGADMSNPSHEILPELMEKALTEMVESLTMWEGPDAMYKLWVNVEKAGGVSSMRRRRDMVGQQRFLGLGNRDYEDEDDNEDETVKDKDDGEFDSQKSAAWWPDQSSGCPSSLEETVMYLLDSGFTPQRCPILREKLKNVVKTRIRNKIEKMKIVINHSATAFVIPDPFGVLEPDEVQIKSSYYNLKMPDGTNSNIVLGNVLLSRNPCKLPTDVRKVKAVEHPVLKDYVDVIVCSIKGSRRFIDYLAGGDYDGDTALAIWEPRLVEPFQNANDNISVEPDVVKPDTPSSCFHSTKETVKDFVNNMRNVDPEERMMELQMYLLRSVSGASLTGMYSTWHDNAVYKHGYGSPQAILLAFKFCKVLDSPKSGLVLGSDVLSSDRMKFAASLGPAWKDPKHTKSRAQSNLTYVQRPHRSEHIKGPFIMDILIAAGEDLRVRLNRQMDVTFAPLGKDGIRDEDLERPWLNASEPVHKLIAQYQQIGDSCMPSSPAGSSRTANSEASGSSSVTIAGPSVQLIIAQAKERDLKRIEDHVKTSYQMHGDNVKKASRLRVQSKSKQKGKRESLGETGGGGAGFTNWNIVDRQDVLRKSSKFFQEHPTPEEMEVFTDPEEIARLRASYAYLYDLEMHKYKEPKWSRFPFDVAARELCAIKAHALGASKTVTRGFYEKYKLVKEF